MPLLSMANVSMFNCMINVGCGLKGGKPEHVSIQVTQVPPDCPNDVTWYLEQVPVIKDYLK